MSDFRRRLMMCKKSESDLPLGCKKLNYLESTGTQYINTKYIPKANTIVDVEFKSNKIFKEVFTVLFGTQNSMETGRFYIIFGSDNDIQCNIPKGKNSVIYLQKDGSYSSTRNNDMKFWINERTHYIINIKANEITVGSKLWNCSNDFTGDFIDCKYPLLLLSRNNGGTAYDKCSKGLLYRATIIEENVVVRDFIPVKDKNNVACLFDIINKEFYYNQGTGEFLYG